MLDPRRSGSLQKNQFQISLVAKRAEGSKWLRSRICHLRENLRPSLSRRSFAESGNAVSLGVFREVSLAIFLTRPNKFWARLRSMSFEQMSPRTQNISS